MWKTRQNARGLTVFAAGFLFGLAILMKQHAALIGLWAVVAFAVDRFCQTSLSVVKRFRPVAVLGAGLVLPFGLCCLILWRAGVFGKFWFWTVDYARQYESVVPIDQAPRLFWERLCRLAEADPLLWLVAGAGLGLVWFDGRLRPARLWLLGFCLMSASDRHSRILFSEALFSFGPAGGGVAGRLRRQRSRWLWKPEIEKLPGSATGRFGAMH